MKIVPHPGEILRDLYLGPGRISTATLARRVGLPLSRLEPVLRGRKPVTAAIALRLAR